MADYGNRNKYKMADNAETNQI